MDLGSFTGIRIGISTVKAIAQSLNIPVIAVSSLEGLAYNITNAECICSLIDARNNQVYCGIFDSKYNLLQDYIADDINTVLQSINLKENITFVGDGAITHKDLLNISDFTLSPFSIFLVSDSSTSISSVLFCIYIILTIVKVKPITNVITILAKSVNNSLSVTSTFAMP